jgi:processive 1,2-diacylglycerol beta-glucosyltransferase
MAPRVLILTASVGEGHDLPARTLAAQLAAERPATEVVTRDGLVTMGRVVGWVSEGAPRVVFFRGEWVWDVGYWWFAECGPTRRATQRLLEHLGAPGLMALLAEVRPDVVVSTWPQTTEVLARLRRRGRLRVPLCAAVTDIAGMHYWAAPGVDLHLITHPESAEEVRRVAGRETRLRAVHGLTDPAFALPRDHVEARRALGLPETGKVVLVSGGGWGVGDVEGAVAAALGVDGVALVVCLCGRNEDLRRRVRVHFADDPRVRPEGFTDRMSDWMAAGDALVHSTGGLTILEAHIRGCPAISYGWGRGHLRPNNAAFQRFGLADVVTSADELRAALAGALTARRPQDLSFAELPSAASQVLALADGGLPGEP